MLNIIKHYKFWFIVSAIISGVCIVALAVFGLKFGIDFQGGTLTQMRIEQNLPGNPEIREHLASDGFLGVTVQSAEEKSVIVRTPPMEKEEHDRLFKSISDKFGQVSEEQFTSIGPVIGRELKQNAIWQLLLVSLGIVLYIAYAFRKVSKPVSSWKFGVAAIVALVHDLLIVIGVFALLGKFLNVEIDSLFVTALLTVLG